MKLFIMFLVGCFVVGIVIRNKPRYQWVITTAIIVFVSIGYYFLNQV